MHSTLVKKRSGSKEPLIKATAFYRMFASALALHSQSSALGDVVGFNTANPMTAAAISFNRMSITLFMFAEDAPLTVREATISAWFEARLRGVSDNRAQSSS
jgi:hypothetical protein